MPDASILALALAPASGQTADDLASRPLSLVLVLAILGVLPFLFMTLTAFVKIATVLHIARLARVGLTEEEIATFTEQLGEIIGHFDVLDRVDTEGVEPTAHTLPLRNVMADDAARPSLPQDEVLAMAPATEDGYLRVRAVLE